MMRCHDRERCKTRYVVLNITPIMLSSQLCDVQLSRPYEHWGWWFWRQHKLEV